MSNTPSGGKIPRNIAITPSGDELLAASQDSNTITVFRRDSKTGRLKADGQVLDIPAPVCMLFVPCPALCPDEPTSQKSP